MVQNKHENEIFPIFEYTSSKITLEFFGVRATRVVRVLGPALTLTELQSVA